MQNEKDVWNFVRPLLSPYGRVDRVENVVGDGMPDVSYCLEGVEGWIELKWAKSSRPTSAFLNQHRMRQSQMNWHAKQVHSGGRSFLLTGRDDEVFLHRAQWFKRTGEGVGWCSLDGANEWTVDDAQANACLHMHRLGAGLSEALFAALIE